MSDDDECYLTPSEDTTGGEGEGDSEGEDDILLDTTTQLPNTSRPRPKDITFFVRSDSTSVVLNNEETIAEIEEAEQFIRSLPVLSYDVIKVSNGFIRLSRTLKLTSEGICNAKNGGGEVTTMYAYRRVKRVALRNTTTLVLQYEDGPHDYVYESPVAVEIAQEISVRLALRRNTDKKKHTLDCLRFQQKMQDSVSVSRLRSPSLRDLACASSFSRESERERNRIDKLAQITGSTDEERVYLTIDKVIVNPETEEGRTVCQFVQNGKQVLPLRPFAAAPSVRQFIDGLRAYILETRMADLCRLLTDAQKEEDDGYLSRVVEDCLEKAVVMPLEETCMKCIRQYATEKEMVLARKMAKLKGRTQSYFGIAESHQSNTNWAAARVEMSYIDKVNGPSAKLNALLSSANAIYTSYQYEQNVKQGGEFKRYYLGADDFLPIIIYVLVHSDLSEPEAIKEYLWVLCDPSDLNGERGYYLTVFNAALQYIRNMNVDAPEG